MGHIMRSSGLLLMCMIAGESEIVSDESTSVASMVIIALLNSRVPVKQASVRGTDCVVHPPPQQTELWPLPFIFKDASTNYVHS